MAALICLANTPYSQSIITDRPDQTESSSTVGAGNLQIETGLLIKTINESQPETRTIQAPSTLFRYGLSDGFEIRVVNQYESSKTSGRKTHGMSDLELGFKVELINNENAAIDMAFLSHLILPNGSSGFTIDGYGIINKLSIAHGVNETMGIGYNLGYDYLGSGSGDLTYSIAFGVAVNDRVGLYFEPYGAVKQFDEFVLNVDAGVTYLLSENLQFDFSFGRGVTDEMNYISFGVSWLAKKK